MVNKTTQSNHYHEINKTTQEFKRPVDSNIQKIDQINKLESNIKNQITKSESEIQTKIDYFTDIYDNKFKLLGEILKQPIKKYQLITQNAKDLKGVISEIYVKRVYQDIYSIYGNVKIKSDKPEIPIFNLPENLETEKIIIIKAYLTTDNHIKFHILDGYIKGKDLIIFSLDKLKPNITNLIEFNMLVNLPGKFPLHINI